MKDMLLQRTFLGLLVTAGGGLFGAVVILIGYDSNSSPFTQKPEFLVWFALIIISMSLVAFFVTPLWLSLIQHKAYWLKNRLDITLSNILLFILFLIPSLFTQIFSFGAGYQPGLPDHFLRISVLLIFSFVALIPAWTGIILIRIVNLSDYSHLISITDEAQIINIVRKYQEDRKLLQRYLTVLGILIGMLMLDTGALRYARIAAGMKESIFPIVLVLIYGLYYTLLLALVYIPTYLVMLDTGNRLGDKLCPLESLDSLIEDAEKRMKIEELLKLGVTTEQSLRAGLIILVPLLSSLLSSLLDLKL